MPRRGENIYKRRDGRWEGRVLKPDGKYHYVYAVTYKEVKEKKKTMQDSLQPRKRQAASAAKNAAEAFTEWLDGDLCERVKPSTYESYSRCIDKYVIPFFRENGQKRITEQAVTQLADRIKNNGLLSESYKRKITSIFKTALKDILKGSDEYAPIVNAVKLPKAESSAIQVFSVREQRLIEQTVMKEKDKRALGILLCFYTGIRLGEICALKWGDIDFEAGTMAITRTVSRIHNFEEGKQKTALVVGMPKSKKSIRTIPLPVFLLDIFRSLKLDKSAESRYMLSGSELPCDPRTYQKLFQKILKSAGVSGRKFHAIRHTFATRALELGVDIKTLSEILGHANVTITLNIYAHSLFEQKKIAIDKFNEMYMAHRKSTSFAVTNSVTTA